MDMGSDMGRDIRDLAERLGDLMKVDVDAVEAYNEAIEKIEEQDLRSRLSAFRDDHQRHVSEISQALQSMGMEVPSQKPDLKGMLIEGMTKLRSAMGTEQALRAMRQNETVTTHAYEDALRDEEWTAQLSEIVERGYADERRHLEWMEQAVETYAVAHSTR